MKNIKFGSPIDMSAITLPLTCPTACDIEDCPMVCHEAHKPVADQSHPLAHCPGVTNKPLDWWDTPLIDGDPVCDRHGKILENHGSTVHITVMFGRQFVWTKNIKTGKLSLKGVDRMMPGDDEVTDMEMTPEEGTEDV